MEPFWPSLYALVEAQARKFGKRPAMSLFGNDRWNTLDYEAFRSKVDEKAQALLRSGHKPGDRIALLGESSLDWPAQFLAIVAVGATAVPLDHKLTETELEQVLSHVQPRTIIVSQSFFEMASRLREKLKLEKLLLIDESYASPLPPLPLPASDNSRTAAIFYTSGTTGNPKGVMLSEKAILCELTMLSGPKEYTETDVVFSILPLNHIYGLNAGILFSIACGAEYVFAHGLNKADIGKCLKDRQATVIFLVPLLLSMMRIGIGRKISELKGAKKLVTSLMLAIAPYLPVALRRKLFAPIHSELGGRLKCVTSGAAPLDMATFDFFSSIGIPVFEGYGLTETGPVLAVNRHANWRRGTVGRPIDGLEVKIVDEEIWARGPSLTHGYYLNSEQTNEALTPDGWFKTGDLGRVDGGGFLSIVGRKKSMIVLGNGKKIYAEEVEAVFSRSSLIAEVCALGITSPGRGEQVVLLVHPSPDLLEKAGKGDEIRKVIEKEVARLGLELADFKRPARVIVEMDPLPKTSSGKVKRHAARAIAQVAAT